LPGHTLRYFSGALAVFHELRTRDREIFMFRAFALCTTAIFALSHAAIAGELAPVPIKPPPASDGSSGSFDAQFANGDGLVWFNTDNGEVWDAASGGYVAFTLPYKTITWNKQSFNAYNFTDMNVESTVNLTIYGSKPAMFLASGDVNFAGQFIIAAAAEAGGTAPNSNDSPYDGGAGSSLKGKSGGAGGDGAIGGVQGQCSPEEYTGGGGGGGGNVSAGGKGLHGDYPVDGPPPAINNPGGKGGRPEKTTVLQGGGGGGAGGGGYWAGDFWGFPGADGGGAVVIATNTGSITIASTGSINADGANGLISGSGTGSSGGGAGGDEWFYAGGSFTNNGSLTATGGAGGTSTYTSGCFNPKTVKGPNGGDGSGGVVATQPADFANNGLIDVSDGGRGTEQGGRVDVVGSVTRDGNIVGRKSESTIPDDDK
jgi:hypothetical protein